MRAFYEENVIIPILSSEKWKYFTKDSPMDILSHTDGTDLGHSRLVNDYSWRRGQNLLLPIVQSLFCMMSPFRKPKFSKNFNGLLKKFGTVGFTSN